MPTLASIVSTEPSEQNVRYGIELSDGARVEAVRYRGDTLCISTQVGCAVRCPFCASGSNGLGRHLSAEEMWAQVELVRELGPPITRITLSGVGEPLHNAAAVEAVIERARTARVAPSLTTSGGTAERLRAAISWPHNGLTLSVHAGEEVTRARLVPHAPTLKVLFAVLHETLKELTSSRRRKIALAYLLLGGENDGDAEVDAFIERARPTRQPIHLYTYNPVSQSDMRGASRARYEEIYARMRAAGLVVRMSSAARTESNGGCGTLLALRPRRA